MAKVSYSPRLPFGACSERHGCSRVYRALRTHVIRCECSIANDRIVDQATSAAAAAAEAEAMAVAAEKMMERFAEMKTAAEELGEPATYLRVKARLIDEFGADAFKLHSAAIKSELYGVSDATYTAIEDRSRDMLPTRAEALLAKRPNLNEPEQCGVTCVRRTGKTYLQCDCTIDKVPPSVEPVPSTAVRHPKTMSSRTLPSTHWSGNGIDSPKVLAGGHSRGFHVSLNGDDYRAL